MKTEIKKFNLLNILPVMGKVFNVLDADRNRLAPWFWWMSDEITPNKTGFYLFILAYLLDTRRKQILHKFNKNNLYDEQFLIFVEDKFSGMIGLDNINVKNKNAELWYFVSAENEGKGIASAAIKKIEDYSIHSLDMNSLYAKINKANERSIKLMKRNNFIYTRIQCGIRTSVHNPKIADIMTWEKWLVK